MTAASARSLAAPSLPVRSLPVLPLLAAFAAAVVVRVSLAGHSGASSVGASVVFAVALATVAAVCRVGVHLPRRAVVAGLLVGFVLVLPAALHDGVAGSLPAGDFPAWAVLTAAVATAEEAFLRGVLYDAVTSVSGADVAIVATAVAFALLHVPFYGWHVVPVDLAVGLALGAVRLLTGTWTASAVAHVTADLAGWWLL